MCIFNQFYFQMDITKGRIYNQRLFLEPFFFFLNLEQQKRGHRTLEIRGQHRSHSRITVPDAWQCKGGKLCYPTASLKEVNTCPQIWESHLQPMRTAVATVATVFGASLRFSTFPDIWLRLSTAYLNMKGTSIFMA